MHTGLSETNYSEGGATATGDCLLPLLLAFPNSEPEPGWGEVVSDSDCSQFGVWRNCLLYTSDAADDPRVV